MAAVARIPMSQGLGLRTGVYCTLGYTKASIRDEIPQLYRCVCNYLIAQPNKDSKCIHIGKSYREVALALVVVFGSVDGWFFKIAAEK